MPVENRCARIAAGSKSLKKKRTAPTLRYCGKENVELRPLILGALSVVPLCKSVRHQIPLPLFSIVALQIYCASQQQFQLPVTEYPLRHSI
jgi:hypothetical protein